MAKSDLSEKAKTDEFSRIFDEYRSKIGEITKKTDKDLSSAIEDTDSHDDAEKGTLAKIPWLSESDRPRTGKSPVESASMINEARRQAQQIIFEAEEAARKEARKRTRVQVAKIMKKAQQEADEIVLSTRRAAERERKEVLDRVQQQSELIIRDITEKARKETEARASQILVDAREKSGKMMSDIIASSSKISHAVVNIVNQARNTIKEFEAKMEAETEALVKAVAESQNIMEQVAIAAREQETNVQPEAAPRVPTKNSDEEPQKPTLGVTLKGDTTAGENGEQPLFCGQVEMKSISPSFEYQYLKGMKKYLVSIPTVKYLQECASEKETSVLFEVQEPLPLFDVLSNIPGVEEVTTGPEGIFVIFKKPTE